MILVAVSGFALGGDIPTTIINSCGNLQGKSNGRSEIGVKHPVRSWRRGVTNPPWVIAEVQSNIMSLCRATASLALPQISGSEGSIAIGDPECVVSADQEVYLCCGPQLN